MKEIAALIAIVLTFAGYIPYMRDTISGKTRPHVYTWFIWALVSFIAFGLQLSDNAGPGAYVTLAACIACIIIFVLGMRQGDKDITTSDTGFLVLALLAIVLWIFAKQPVASIILASSTEFLAFVPTVRKSWHRPHEETLASYVINTFRHGLSVYSLQRYTIITTLYPASWTIANGIFAIVLLMRRKKLG